MSGELRINDAGLQEASSSFSLLSEDILQAASSYRTDGNTVKGSWTGLGSEAFSKSFDMIGQLMDKVSLELKSESQAVLSANERFKEADKALANSIGASATSFTKKVNDYVETRH